jgi:anion-transporting  ArsA/GET3 family ATPase
LSTLRAVLLSDVVKNHRVVVCLGSGGVGKTTTSAAIALRAALEGRRVLCLTIDPAKRLANSLGLSEITSGEQQIDPAVLAKHGLTESGSLSAMMLDMKKTFDDLVTRNASSEAQKQRILGNRLYQYVSTSLAGTQEYMAMEKLHSVRRDSRFDFIVLDTPPTTNALDFLEAPNKLVGAIDSPVMRWFVEQLEGNKGLSILGRGAAYVLRGLAKFTGAEFLELVGQFVTDLNELFGGFRQRAQAVYEDLRSDDVAFLIVTSPAPIAVGEAVFFSKKLGEYGIKPRGIVVNRVHKSEPVPTLEQLVALSAEQASILPGGELPSALIKRMHAAASDAEALARRDQEGVRRLRAHVGSELSYTEVPALRRDVHDLSALSEVGDCLLGVRA